MAKSIIKLPDGTLITIDGSPEEIKNIVSIYSLDGKKEVSPKMEKKKEVIPETLELEGINEDVVLQITNYIKQCEDGDAIESKILNRTSQVDRVLLPLHIASKLKNKPLLTSGDIHGVLKELGIKIAVPNIANTLKGTARKYVIGDKRTKRGQAVGYQISRPGDQYILKVIKDPKND